MRASPKAATAIPNAPTSKPFVLPKTSFQQQKQQKPLMKRYTPETISTIN